MLGESLLEEHEFLVKDTDGKVVIFKGTTIATPASNDKHFKTSASDEALAFVREYGRLIQLEASANVLFGDMAEAMAVPCGCVIADYLAKIPADHVFNRFVAKQQEIRDTRPESDRYSVAWKITNPETLEARLNAARQLVDLAEELLPGMLTRPSPDRWPLLREMLPVSYRQRIYGISGASPVPGLR